ncbi:MAG: hypothetical protein ACI4XB_03445 [Ruminococcus sp.]
MVSETVQQVLSAESAADTLLAETKAKCSRIIEDAEAYADRICKEKTEAADAEGTKLRAENQARAEQYSRAAAEECARKQAEIRQKADKNMDAAVELILSQLFG